MSLGLLFVDLSTAFASVVRALAMPTDATDSAWKERLMTTGFTSEEVENVFSEVHGMNEWVAARGSRHVQALLKELHVGT